jgi:hypothetical protein
MGLFVANEVNNLAVHWNTLLEKEASSGLDLIMMYWSLICDILQNAKISVARLL